MVNREPVNERTSETTIEKNTREREREKRASNQRVARVNREAKKEGWEGRTSWKLGERKRQWMGRERHGNP